MELELRICTPLSHFALDLDEEIGGGVTAVVGPSGAGKTTVLETIAGLQTPDSGRLVFGGQVWLDTDTGELIAPTDRGIGYVFQDLALFPNLSAEANVAWGIAGTRAQRRRRSRELLRTFGLEGDRERAAIELSGGERRRVALARALGTEPRMLLLDEPLTGLDAKSRRDAIAALRLAVAAVEGPTLLVTHNFADAGELAEDVLVLESGRVAQRGSAATIGADPASRFVASLVGANVLEGLAQSRHDGLTEVSLPSGATLLSADRARGPVVATVFPLDITVSKERPASSALNSLEAEVEGISALGPHTRVRLGLPEPVIAEITTSSAGRLGLVPGRRVFATWKAVATRLVSG